MAPVRSVSAVRIRRCRAPWPSMDQALGVEPAGRDAPRHGRRDDRAGARPEPDLVVQGRAASRPRRRRRRAVVHGGQAELAARSQRHALPKASSSYSIDDLVDAVLRGLARPAEADSDAGQALELERDVLEDVRLVGPAPEPLEEAAAVADAAAVLDHRRQPGHQPLVEPGKLVGRRILQRPEIDPGLRTGKLAQMFGPRKARIFRNSIP